MNLGIISPGEAIHKAYDLVLITLDRFDGGLSPRDVKNEI